MDNLRAIELITPETGLKEASVAYHESPAAAAKGCASPAEESTPQVKIEIEPSLSPQVEFNNYYSGAGGKNSFHAYASFTGSQEMYGSTRRFLDVRRPENQIWIKDQE